MDNSSPQGPVRKVLLPEYDSPMGELLAQCISEISRIENPILQNIAREKVDHISESSSVGYGRSTGPQLISTTAETSWDDLTNTDIHAWSTFVHQTGSQLGEAMTRNLFEFIEKVTEETGNVFDGRGDALSLDLFLDMLEKLEFPVDEAGNPTGLQLVVNPDMAERLKNLPPPTPEQEERHKAILKKKLEIQNANKRIRKLD